MPRTLPADIIAAALAVAPQINWRGAADSHACAEADALTGARLAVSALLRASVAAAKLAHYEGRAGDSAHFTHAARGHLAAYNALRALQGPAACRVAITLEKVFGDE
jgi:hypothetical protein